MKKQEYTCTVVFTEGWQKRVTEAFVDLYYQRLQGIGQLEHKETKKQATA